MAAVRPNRSSSGARVRAIAVAALSLAGCQFDTSGPGAAGGGTGSPPDANVVPEPDASTDPDAAPADGAPHLLLTEVKAEATAGEFIEIFNPTSAAVSLDDYYLSDDSLYASLPQLVRDGGAISIRNRDAILQFPPGHSLAPGQVVVIAGDEAGFAVTFPGQMPDFVVHRADIPVVTPMLIRAGSSTSTLELTDSGEAVILFTWDGGSDLVTDVDMVVVGTNPGDTDKDNGLPDKTDLSLDGPDADAIEQLYAPDMVTMAPMLFRSGATGSYKRLALEGEHELRGGGNGVAGHDETSEDSRATWEQSPSAPTPGEVPGAVSGE